MYLLAPGGLEAAKEQCTCLGLGTYGSNDLFHKLFTLASTQRNLLRIMILSSPCMYS